MSALKARGLEPPREASYWTSHGEVMAWRYAEALGEILGQPWFQGRFCPCCFFDLRGPQLKFVRGEWQEETHEAFSRNEIGVDCAWLIAAKAGGVL